MWDKIVDFFTGDNRTPEGYPKHETAIGPPEFGDYLDRTKWYNPIRGTNLDQYIIAVILLVSFLKIKNL